MGVSFIGIAAKVDTNTIINSLKSVHKIKQKKLKIVFDCDCTFDSMLNRKPEPNIIDLFSNEHGTICTYSDTEDVQIWTWALSSFFDFVYFDISETSMEHRFAFFSNGVEQVGMNVYDFGDKKRIAGDNFLNIQDSEDIFMETFDKALMPYIKVSVHTIDNSTLIERYKVIPEP